MFSREQIERLLLDEVEITKGVYERCRAEFRTVVSDVPSGIPHPDGQARILNAKAATSSALEQYALALREFNDFVLRSVIPEHLKGP